jgi:hypothetical protein
MTYTLVRKQNSHTSMHKNIGSTSWSLGIPGSMKERSLAVILKQKIGGLYGSSSTGTLIALILFRWGEESDLLNVRYIGDHSLYIG